MMYSKAVFDLMRKWEHWTEISSISTLNSYVVLRFCTLKIESMNYYYILVNEFGKFRLSFILFVIVLKHNLEFFGFLCALQAQKKALKSVVRLKQTFLSKKSCYLWMTDNYLLMTKNDGDISHNFSCVFSYSRLREVAPLEAVLRVSVLARTGSWEDRRLTWKR